MAAGHITRIAVIPAAGLYGLPALASLGIGDQLVIRLDSADTARAVLRALRVEAWIIDARARGAEAPLPIPADAGFRLTLEPRRFNNLIHEIQIGNTILDAALAGAVVRQVSVDHGIPVDHGLPSSTARYQPMCCAGRPADASVALAEMVLEAARA